jgi:hypothetical protein
MINTWFQLGDRRKGAKSRKRFAVATDRFPFRLQIRGAWRESARVRTYFLRTHPAFRSISLAPNGALTQD